MKIQESAENYLETILILQQRNGCVRSIDIATELEFSKPSVSHAMKQLRENDLIVMDENMLISLTISGFEIAGRIYERHRILTKFLEALGVDPARAREDACKMEHDLSQESFDKIKNHYFDIFFNKSLL